MKNILLSSVAGAGLLVFSLYRDGAGPASRRRFLSYATAMHIFTDRTGMCGCSSV